MSATESTCEPARAPAEPERTTSEGGATESTGRVVMRFNRGADGAVEEVIKLGSTPVEVLGEAVAAGRKVAYDEGRADERAQVVAAANKALEDTVAEVNKKLSEATDLLTKDVLEVWKAGARHGWAARKECERAQQPTEPPTDLKVLRQRVADMKRARP